MKTYAFVFARGGSKGLPGKNIRPMAGKPLLAYSIEIAKRIKSIDDVFISTDDAQIQNVAHQLGAKVISRPVELAMDDTPEWLAWQHAIEYVRKAERTFDKFISIPTTAPLRNEEDIENCLDALSENNDVVVTVTESSRSPWFNMLKLNNSGMASLLFSGKSKFTRRQDAPKTYDMTTVAYVAWPGFIMKANGIFEGRVKAVKIPKERALDIDTELDFVIAECLFEKREQYVGGADA
ncbi:CMP-N-acetylneuraminic acid synthetase [Candidatus Desulfarcum epimagneticum]|uniref:CMP-N-acetylneuraminic acid synthetase n=1 Tax=uncultured Desulfobacteraceae bacterium TaxID=218296 RepID=A0A484HGZ7_9BACT|nr:CMP-N-acetylneuraminic acid synthetase [uncultured Desulfobacteraceae bacterium]